MYFLLDFAGFLHLDRCGSARLPLVSACALVASAFAIQRTFGQTSAPQASQIITHTHTHAHKHTSTHLHCPAFFIRLRPRMRTRFRSMRVRDSAGNKAAVAERIELSDDGNKAAVIARGGGDNRSIGSRCSRSSSDCCPATRCSRSSTLRSRSRGDCRFGAYELRFGVRSMRVRDSAGNKAAVAERIELSEQRLSHGRGCLPASVCCIWSAIKLLFITYFDIVIIYCTIQSVWGS